MIKVTCYGPRGSIPAPSRKGRNGEPDFNTSEYGGNTSAYLIEAGPFKFLTDFGSGSLVAGDYLLKTGQGFNGHFICPISHWHHDHIQGLPFCSLFFIASNTFHFHGFAPSGRESHVPFGRAVESVLIEQQDAPHFPVSHSAMPGKKFYHSHHFQFSETFTYFANEDGSLVYNATQMIGQAHETLPADIKNDPRRWVTVTTVPLNHPNGCLGFLIQHMGDTLFYGTDNEPLLFLNAQITKHAKKANWMLLDGQYTPEQLAGAAQGFGHGTPRNCVDQAKACETEHLVIHHHDPRHDDTKLAAMEADAMQYAKDIGFNGTVEFAREGKSWTFGFGSEEG